jgi:predicted RNA-binding Zn ribbon-like protein
VGERVCLDFVNTVHDRFTPVREDYIFDKDRYLRWSRRVGLLSAAEFAVVFPLPVNKRFMEDVRKFREQLYAFLLEYTRGRVSSLPATLAFWTQRAWAGLRFNLGSPNFVIWSKNAIDVYLPLKRIALDALDMLQHGERSRLRCCAARGECGWLFYDKSKNGTRRWCSMETCGAIAKMRRYRHG